jgi:hypothetical protein
MIKCSKDNVDSATYRATVMVCPTCGRILDAKELLRLLKRLGFSKKLTRQVRTEIKNKNRMKKQ